MGHLRPEARQDGALRARRLPRITNFSPCAVRPFLFIEETMRGWRARKWCAFIAKLNSSGEIVVDRARNCEWLGSSVEMAQSTIPSHASVTWHRARSLLTTKTCLPPTGAITEIIKSFQCADVSVFKNICFSTYLFSKRSLKTFQTFF